MLASSAMEDDVFDEAAADHDDDDDDYKQQKQPIRFRLLDAARYVVAILVTALTIAIVARAVQVSLRPEELQLSIMNAYVMVDTITSMKVGQKDGVHFKLNYRCYNPSGRAGVWYHKLNVTLLYSNETEVTWFQVPENLTVTVEPQISRRVYLNANLTLGEEVPTEFARWIYSGHEWKDMIVRFQGVLETQVSLLKYSKGQPTEFLCPQVTIGNSSSYYNTTAVAQCTLQ